MSTQFTLVLDGASELLLDERSGKFDLDVYLPPGVVEQHDGVYVTLARGMGENELVELATKLIGPLHYQDPDTKIIERIIKRLDELGYT